MDNLLRFFLLTVPMLFLNNLWAQDCGVNIDVVEENSGYVLKANAKGGDAFTYSWSNGMTTQSISVTEKTAYCVTITTPRGCAADACFKFDDVSSRNCHVNIKREKRDGGILLTIDPRPADLVTEIGWSDGSSEKSLLVTKSGEYCVKVAFSNGCTAGKCVKVNIPGRNCKVEIRKELVDGGIKLTAIGGNSLSNVANSFFVWSTGDTARSITVTELMKYCVVAYYGDECKAEACIDLRGDGCKVEIRKEDVDGGIKLTAVSASVSPATTPPTYEWSTGETTQSIVVTERDKYCVVVHYGDICKADACIDLRRDDQCRVHIQSRRTDEGILLTAKVTPANVSARYFWNNSDTATTESILVTERGEYCVKIITEDGCEARDCINIGDDGAECSVEIVRRNTDEGILLTAKVRPEDANVRYFWNNSDTAGTESILVTERGEYCVKVIVAGDSISPNGCEARDCIKIGGDEKDCRVEIIRRNTDEGILLIAKVRPEDANVRYFWNNSDTAGTESILVTERGEYCVKVIVATESTATNACVAEDCIKIGDDEADCKVEIVRRNTDEGILLTAKVRPEGAVVRYFWQIGDSTHTTESVLVTERGEYCVKVLVATINSTTADGCEATDCIIIGDDEPDCKVEIARRVTDEGIILTAKVRPEDVEVRYFWELGDSIAHTQSILVTERGEYCVKIITEDGCEARACIKINNDPNCGISFSRQITAAGLLVTVKPRPKGQLKELFWDTGDTTRSILITAAGTYCVEAIFKNGCVVKECFTIEDIDELCKVEIYPRRTGAGVKLHAVPRPADGIDSIVWNTGELGKQIMVNVDGSYCVTVYWESGCIAEACVDIVITDETDTCRAIIRVLNGSTLQAKSNGKAPFDYSWNTGEVTKNIKINDAGTYCVTITDSEGCISSSCVEIENINEFTSNSKNASNSTTTMISNKSKNGKKNLFVIVPEQGNTKVKELSIHPNPARNQINFSLDIPYNDTYEISVQNMQGQITHFEKTDWLQGQANGRVIVSNLPEGFYILRIQSAQQLITKKFLKQ